MEITQSAIVTQRVFCDGNSCSCVRYVNNDGGAMMIGRCAAFTILRHLLSAFVIMITLPSWIMAESTPVADPSINLPSFSRVVELLTPVTVNISSTKTVKSQFRQYGGPFGDQEQMDQFKDFFGEDFFRKFFGEIPEREFKQQALGSGFIIDSDGYILTNNHVIEGADKIKVKAHNQKEYDAEIVGRDPKTDLALIKIVAPSGELAAARLGNSDVLKVGEWVIAIGNPFGLQETVTVGIVSAKWRKIGAGPYEDFIQTDASINPGNSGGPLFNLQGEVVGVNTMIYSPSGGNVGIGFAIPINLAKNIVQQLKEKGRVVRGWLGVVVQGVTPELADSFGLPEGTGALIADVEQGGPAYIAGIKPGDVIIEFNGKQVKEMGDLPLMVAETPIGKKIEVIVIRSRERKSFTVKIGELKEKQTDIRAEAKKEKLGIVVQDITPELANAYGLSEADGVIIVAVEQGSSADIAGLRKGDIIKEIDRKAISSTKEYYEAIESMQNGNVLMLIKRGRSSLWVVIKPKE